MADERTTVVRRKKREVAYAPRSGANGYRLTSWGLAVATLTLVAMVHHKVGLHPGDKLLPMLTQSLLFLVPPVGAVAGLVAFMLSKSRVGKALSLVPALTQALLWLWLIWELME